MHVGWICVKHGFANAAPRLYARQIAVTLRALGVRREIEDVSVAARAEDDGVGEMRLDRAGHHVARHDAARAAAHDDQVEHLVPRVHRHAALRDLLLERLIRAEQQLLTGLSARVERARHLRAAERPVRQQAAVLARERHALRRALVDDVHAEFGEAIDVASRARKSPPLIVS